jgi:DNA-binding NarL/FixJ family response regulator
MPKTTVLLVSHDASFVGWFDYEVGRMDALRLDAMDEVDAACARVLSEKIGVIVIHLSTDIGSAEVARLLYVSSTLRRPVPVIAISERYQIDRALMLFQLGVTDYLSRSHHRNHLRDVIAALTARNSHRPSSLQGADAQEKRDALSVAV